MTDGAGIRHASRMRTAEQEVRSPKYAVIERERRFLVDRDRRPMLDGLPGILIEDRYLVGTRLRLRRMTNDTGAVALKFAKKYEADDPLARPMVTAYLTTAEYDALVALPARTVTKRRHEIETPHGVFGLDVFFDVLAGLGMAEIECGDDTELRAVTVPAWIKVEVSHDPRFQGGHLATLDAVGLAKLLNEPSAIDPE